MPIAAYDQEGNILGTLRLLSDIFGSVQALTAQQRTNLCNDLKAPVAGAPRKYLSSEGPNAAAMFALDWAANLSTGGQLASSQNSVMACYIQDYPTYAVNPSFDPSINIKGYTPQT